MENELVVMKRADWLIMRWQLAMVVLEALGEENFEKTRQAVAFLRQMDNKISIQQVS